MQGRRCRKGRSAAAAADTETLIVILTGAGISAESGLGTFRDTDGLWSQYDLAEVATPQGYARNPKLVLDFYNARRRNLLNAQPNAAHEALVRLERERPGKVAVITQNIDDLHIRAGSRGVIQMHGALLESLCTACAQTRDWREDMTPESRCPDCDARGTIRPNVVWFGEMPYHMERIDTLLSCAEVFVSIGTSGSVYPAAGFVADCAARGIPTLELNLEPSETVTLFDDSRTGPASDLVPEWVEEILTAPKGSASA